MAEQNREQLWGSIDGIYRKICEHPFIAGLTDGTLGRNQFHHYLVQDAHYLQGYARALKGCAAMAPIASEQTMFAEHADVAITAEAELHSGLLAELAAGVDPAAAGLLAPTTQAYVSYLMSVTASGSYAEAVAAVLPCYWIYARVGEHLQRHGSPEPLFQRWIDTYAGEEYQAVVEEVLAVADRVGMYAPAAEWELMLGHLRTAARYEWMFFDAAHRLEDWPV
jgi:thiaminase/transcriptional activator TenA